jgi:hypothetical protein
MGSRRVTALAGLWGPAGACLCRLGNCFHVAKHPLLHFGPYRCPRIRYGAIVRDEVRSRVEICRLTDARIPWPIGKIKWARSMFVYGAHVRAVRKESNTAICYWWGITPQTVRKWRRALGVGMVTEGTRRLWQIHAASPEMVEARKRAVAKARDPQRRAKIAASRRGKKRPPEVIEAMRRGQTGKPHSEETRQKIREAHRRRREGFSSV